MTESPAHFVNLIDVDPAQQKALVALITDAAEEVIRHRPGFRSLVLLASSDGRRVISIACWGSEDDARRTQSDPRMGEFAARVAEIGQSAAGTYRLVHEVR